MTPVTPLLQSGAVKLTAEQRRHIQRAHEAQRRRDQADREHRQAIVAAATAGVPQARLADEFGVSRMSVWRWVSGATTPQRRASAAPTASPTATHGGTRARRSKASQV